MQFSNALEHVGGSWKRTVSRIAGGTFLALASLFIVNVGVAHGATPVEVESITWNPSGWWEIDVANPGGYATPANTRGLLPMRGLYGGADGMYALYPNGTYTSLKCKSTLASYPYYATATSSGEVNISLSFHNGSYNGPFASDAGNVVCSSPGVYYVQWNMVGGDGNSDTYYFEYYWTGTEIEEINPEWWIANGLASTTYSTRFLNAIFSSSTATIGYYINTADFVGQFDRPDVVMVKIGSTDNPNLVTEQKIILPLTTGNATTTLTFDTPVSDGTYTAFVNFWNMSDEAIVFNRSNMTINFTVSGGVVTVQTTAQQTNGLLPPSQEFEQECGLTSISGCISNAFRFLFYPSTESINTFMGSYALLQTKIPFVYVYQATGMLSGLYTGTSANVPTITISTPIGPITFISQTQINAIPFVSLLRSLISAGLWIMLFVVL